jgi:general secretion pathway protein K
MTTPASSFPPLATPRRAGSGRARGERRRRANRGGGARGVALILVLVTIALLTALGVDFSYSARIDLRLAETMRDETRAHFLARSAINLSRLLLHFQKQLDGVASQLGPMLGKLGSTMAAATTGKPQQAALPALAGQPQGASLGIRLWEILPIDSNLLSSFVGGSSFGGSPDDFFHKGAPPPPPARDPGDTRSPSEIPANLHSFGGFDGSYSAKISDENTRINVVGLDGLGAQQLPAYLQLKALMQDPKYDFIFEEEDANRDRVRREDVIIALKDWIDVDEVGSAIDPTNPRAPFVNGFSDENQAYDRYVPRYKAKNDRPDSLEELYMVRGVNDRFMAAFGDRVTIWLDKNARININSSDPLQTITNIIAAAANPNDPRLTDPRLLATVLQELQLRRMVSFFGLSVADFIGTLEGNGIVVRPELKDPRNPGQFFGDVSDTFRITATGRVGRIEKKITAVVRYDDLLGKLLYWKED